MKKLLFLLLVCNSCYAVTWECKNYNPSSWQRGYEICRFYLFNGWLVKSDFANNIVYIKDEKHEWKL